VRGVEAAETDTEGVAGVKVWGLKERRKLPRGVWDSPGEK